MHAGDRGRWCVMCAPPALVLDALGARHGAPCRAPGCVQEQDLYGLNLLCFDPKEMLISGELA